MYLDGDPRPVVDNDDLRALDGVVHPSEGLECLEQCGLPIECREPPATRRKPQLRAIRRSNPDSRDLLVSVVISTYNRRPALYETLRALERQTLLPDRYEVLVVDDGSSDDTWAQLSAWSFAYPLRTFRQAPNVGISAAKNVGLREALGRYVVIMADDLVAPPEFLALHVATLEQNPGCWVVGGFEQLPSLRETPFGRYLDTLEDWYRETRKQRELSPGLWEIGYPTSRNMSMPRADLERVGLFDEQFRRGCEEQDLAERAKAALGTRFLYNEALTSLHNDQAGDRRRYCRAVANAMHDTVFFCAKYPGIHGRAAVVRVNGYCQLSDGPVLLAKKLAKCLLAWPLITELVQGAARAGEILRLPDAVLFRIYHVLMAVYIFRGWRAGLRTLERCRAVPAVPAALDLAGDGRARPRSR